MENPSMLLNVARDQAKDVYTIEIQLQLNSDRP